MDRLIEFVQPLEPLSHVPLYSAGDRANSLCTILSRTILIVALVSITAKLQTWMIARPLQVCRIKDSPLCLVLGLLLASLTTVPDPAEGRDREEDFQTWGVVVATGSLGSLDQRWNRALYSLEGHGRFGNDSSRFSQGIIRPALGYALNAHHSVWLGGDWVPTSRPFAIRDDFNEYRSWQQWLWSDTFSFGTLVSRSRFEQRYFDIPDTEDVGHRYRHLLKVSLPIRLLDPDFNLILGNELFVNLTHADATSIRQGFDQNRAIVGFSYRVGRTTVMEIGYMNQYLSRKGTARPDQMQHILLTTLLLNL